ncbi:hypothetical protein [Dactylosporangium sp. NPDC005555]|uniref:hypothetical protein n=1 Tax=Dactylosporangium sp. NPDC005555 TaxID=3154889 RepID=UPI0033ACAB2F
MAESYGRWRLPQLWEMVAADDAANAHLHLATLRRQQTALETHRDRLRTLRDQLAEAWPPQKSEAATMFLQRLNDMIDALTATARGAADVRVGMEVIADAINGAREQLAPLVERYAKAESVPDPRVKLQAKKVLDQEARRILVSADGTVREAATALQVALPAYGRISTLTDVPSVGGGEPGSTGGGGAGAGSGGAKYASASSGALLPPRFEPPSSVIADAAQTEVVLAGDQPGVQANGRRPGEIGPVQANGVPPHGAIGAVGRVLGGGPAIGMFGPGTEAAVRGSGAGMVRGLPGNVIGGAPAATTRGGVMRAPAASPRTAPDVARPPAGSGGYRDRSFEEYAAHRRGRDAELEEQWKVQQGVPPLLEAPPPVRDHDPGPGVIGLDR